MRCTDVTAAIIPTAATISLSQLNTLVGIVGGLLGIAYLLWKWHHEASKP